jgi:hypothetical protein
MGLLTRVRERVKDRAADTARRIVVRAKETLENRLGLPTDRSEDPLRAGGGPSFADAADRGRDGWESGRQLLEQSGLASFGLLQARFTDSELALRDALDRLEAAVSAAGGSSQAWKAAAERLYQGWQDQNARILEAWQGAFERLDRSWATSGEAARQLPWKRGWSDASASFDTAWLGEWDKFQAVLEDVCSDLKKLFQDVSAMSGLEPAVPVGIWQRAVSSVDGGIRRAHGDLWGAWGTGGALLRGCARKILEEEGTPAQIYPPAFARLEEDFGRAIRVNVRDVRDSWTAAVDLLIRAVGGAT